MQIHITTGRKLRCASFAPVSLVVRANRKGKGKCMSWLSDLLKEYPALSVAKERLALAEDRFKNIEQENTQLKDRITELETQNALLKSRVPEKTTGELEELEIEILKILSAAGDNGSSAGVMARRLDINETKAEYYAEKLAEEEYLYQSFAANMPVNYSLGQRVFG